MANPYDAWLRIQIGGLSQLITLTTRPRHFGGHQWYFRCPRMGRRASVLWMPPGAESFACRQRWGRQVAYQSQFLDAVGRAHLGKARINKRLCSIGSLDPDEWDFPPKPKWMRWSTYHRAEAKFDRYEESVGLGLDGVPRRGVAGGIGRRAFRHGRADQRATAGRLMRGSSLNWPTLSSVM